MSYIPALRATLFLVASLPILASAASESPPNILFIMTDQQHAGMMSCTGNPYVNTPALDGLAASGIRFELAYATNPVCVPSRFSLQTGRMPSAVGMRTNNSRVAVPPEMRANSLAPLLKNAGYRCAYGGKVHLPGELNQFMFKAGYEQLTRDSRDDLAKTSAAFIQEKHDRPFFLFVSFINPHDICYMAINDFARTQGEPARDNIDSSVCEEILDEARKSPDLAAFIRDHCPPLPDNFEPPENEPECIATDYTPEGSFKRYARNEWTRDMWRLHRWLYARLTERVDAQIGQVLQAVADAGLEKESLIIFTSDHGDMDGSHRLEHKGVLYEESARVPFLASWKGHIPAGKVDNAHLVSNGLDLLPTLCDYAGIDAPANLPGRTLRPLLQMAPADKKAKAEEPWRAHLVVESARGRMVRTTDFKYCIYESGAHREMLIDLQADPGEMKNLATDPAHRKTLATHRRLLRTWVQNQNDTIAAPYLE